MAFIVAMVVPFGSGCSYIAENFFCIKRKFTYISLSKILRKEYIDQYPTIEEKNISREDLQAFGDEVRRIKGCDYLAKQAIAQINDDPQLKEADIVIDSIRNPHEIEAFRSEYVNFYVFGIFAATEIRWERIKDIYGSDQGKFAADEKRDKGEKIEYGQRVTDSFLASDVIILNENEITGENDAAVELNAKITRYIDLFKGTAKNKAPSENESIMAMAYSNSLRSSCINRKVGAVIVDKNGNVFSSGYNEVPLLERPCLNKYGKCYRSFARDKIRDLFPENEEALKTVVMDRVKLLEKCRALHAEENAILNIARFGSASALSDATLFTTTYPCNLCANKIAQVGIKKVVYFEPYPVEEAKVTLSKARIVQQMFEGITFNSYFKVYNEIIL